MSEREIKAWLLRALEICGDRPMPDSTLRASTRLAFPHLALTEADLGRLIRDLEREQYLTGTADDILGLQWMLTPKGKLKAALL
jgi:hypothetical protein